MGLWGGPRSHGCEWRDLRERNPFLPVLSSFQSVGFCFSVFSFLFPVRFRSTENTKRSRDQNFTRLPDLTTEAPSRFRPGNPPQRAKPLNGGFKVTTGVGRSGVPPVPSGSGVPPLPSGNWVKRDSTVSRGSNEKSSDPQNSSVRTLPSTVYFMVILDPQFLK